MYISRPTRKVTVTVTLAVKRGKIAVKLVTLNAWGTCTRTANFPSMHKPHKLTKNTYHMMLLETSIAVVFEIEVLHHRLFVGLHAFWLPTTVYSTAEGLRERYRTNSEDAGMHATIMNERHWRQTITGRCKTAHVPRCLQNRSWLARQATPTQIRPHYERCADYKSRSAI